MSYGEDDKNVRATVFEIAGPQEISVNIARLSLKRATSIIYVTCIAMAVQATVPLLKV